MTKARITIKCKIVPDESPDASYLEQADFEGRLTEYQRGNFDFVGVQAVAEIAVPYGKDWIMTCIKSPGLWGIESDSGQAYFDEVYAEERATLFDMLASLRDYEVVS